RAADFRCDPGRRAGPEESYQLARRADQAEHASGNGSGAARGLAGGAALYLAAGTGDVSFCREAISPVRCANRKGTPADRGGGGARAFAGATAQSHGCAHAEKEERATAAQDRPRAKEGFEGRVAADLRG